MEPTPFGDKYVLVEHIATGGMAEIYRAHYAGIEGFAKELVIKTLRAEFAARPQVVDMFLDEARVAATLTHNNVVHTYDLGEIAGHYFIAMELLKGEELVAVMRRAVQNRPEHGPPVPLEMAVGVIMQACEGLHYVHTRTDDQGVSLGLVHRDINPTNIHVGYDGVCKILDFGIAATRASAVAQSGQVAGKLAYMAPEQLQGRTIDHRADIFPLGVMLYELCLGRRLFRGPRDEVARRVLEGDIPAPTFIDPQFSPALEAIIMQALEVDPQDRYQNCDHMFRDLEAFCAGAGISPSPRRISAVMSELFGAGAPAQVNYEDPYDDVDVALDFAAFEAVPSEASDEVPEWARGIEDPAASTPRGRRKRVTIGNLEALVAEGKFDETGPHPVAPGPSPTKSAPLPVGRSMGGGSHLAGPGAQGSRQGPVDPRPMGATDTPGDSNLGRPYSDAGGLPPAAFERPAGEVPLRTYERSSSPSRPFGDSVVTRASSGPGWGWVVGILIVSLLGWVFYTIITLK